MTVGAHQHVGRLYVAVQHAVLMGICQRAGQPRADPTDRFRPARPLQLVPRHRIRRRLLAVARQRPIDGLQQRAATAHRRGNLPGMCYDVLQRAAGNVLHVQQPQLERRQPPLIEHAHDVRMIELRQRLRLEAPVARDLQGHQPLHRALPSEKHGGKCPLAQGRQQIEVVDPLSWLEAGNALDAHQRGRLLGTFKLQQLPKFVLLRRKTIEVVANRHVVAPLAANVILFIDDVAGHAAVGGQFGELAQVVLDGLWPAPPLPTVFQVDLDRLDQHQSAQCLWSAGQKVGQRRWLGRILPGRDEGIEMRKQRLPNLRRLGFHPFCRSLATWKSFLQCISPNRTFARASLGDRRSIAAVKRR